jgi:squalene-hopene/tetraprenyl-beta-curcumene cyclase
VKDSRVTIDQPCPALTGRVVMALHALDGRVSERAEHALRYVASVQQPDGAVASLWFRTPVYGTAMTLDAHVAIGRGDSPVAARCRAWLLANQNGDGSWGTEHGDPGTVEETGWALAALLADGAGPATTRMRAAADWLLARQRSDGTWPQAVIGVYYLSLVYSSDHIATAAALGALARYRAAAGA